MKKLFILLLSFSSIDTALAIKKCQDADGNWHYGDVAVQACENSKITTLNDRGFVKEELEAPKTEAELIAEKEQKEAQEAEAKKNKEIEEERLRILSIYETEDDIDRQRDNQLNSVQSNIDVHNAYLKSMDIRVKRFEKKRTETSNQTLKDNYQKKIEDAKVKIANYQKQLEGLNQQKKDIMKKFEEEKRLYLAIKNGTIDSH